jgi:MFS transporter, DHA1 family, multidrug resistance protein
VNRTIALLALLTAFPPLSTDMYLPAIPLLREQWNQPLVAVNLTLIGFFVTYCLFILVYGPISDRFGRRRPLMVGIGIFMVASIGCALSNSIRMLILARVFQAAGAASASALGLAMCKDLFDGLSRARIMAHIAVIMALAPMLAPIMGGWVLYWLSWPWIFMLQASIGMIAFIGVFKMEEPLKSFSHINFANVLKVYFRVLCNGRFTCLMLAMSMLVFPFFAFIAGCSEIYISDFGISERTFGYFFGFNALAIMIGPLTFSYLSRHISQKILIAIGFTGIMTGGFWMILIPHTSPWSLALPMWVLSFFLGLCRPPTNNLILEQVDQDIGAASSLVIFTFMMIGSVSMGIISLAWLDKITVLGIMGAASGGFALLFWLRYSRFFILVEQFK